MGVVKFSQEKDGLKGHSQEFDLSNFSLKMIVQDYQEKNKRSFLFFYK